MEKQDIRNNIFRYFFLIAAFPALGQNSPSPPKNIILFIGDGMGVAHVTAAKTVKGILHLERFPVGGLATTHSADQYVTDSAAGATALSTGIKTNNGMLAISPSGDTLKTVLEFAEQSGKSTGLVATCRITHATPAAFAAHTFSRDDEDVIAEHLVGSGVDVLFGGGWGYFLPNSDTLSLRKDGKDLWSEVKKRHSTAFTKEDFDVMGIPGSAVGLFNRGHLPPAGLRSVSLASMTGKALDILSADPDGFFLMVEGSQIDWDAHDNDSDGLILETIDFDDAVGVGLSFLSRNPNTLVVVTADHETGGYALLDGSVTEQKITQTHFSTVGHSGTMVPVFAAGPGSDRFGGIHDNTFIGKTLIDLVRNH